MRKPITLKFRSEAALDRYLNFQARFRMSGRLLTGKDKPPRSIWMVSNAKPTKKELERIRAVIKEHKLEEKAVAIRAS